MRLEKGTTMTTHVNQLKTISEHLEALDDVVQEKDLVMILISSLPDDYNNLITAMETLKEEKLTWVYVRDRVLHEYERKRGTSSVVDKENSKALFTNQKQKKKGYDDNKKKNFEYRPTHLLDKVSFGLLKVKYERLHGDQLTF